MAINLPVTLGSFPGGFVSFETPEIMKFGGPERVSIHRMPNGARTIDILGRDDGPFAWSGIFLSANATERAKILEGMKIAGGVNSLAFGSYQRDVVITKLEFVYHRANWIDYSIECTPIFNADTLDPQGQAVAGLQAGINNAAGAGP